MRIEETILNNLLHNDEYSRKVTPFIKPEYFEERNEKIMFEEYTKLFLQYNNVPNAEMIANEVFNRKDLYDNDHKLIQDAILKMKEPNDVNENWLYDKTEDWCKERAVYNTVMDAIKIIDGRDKQHTKDAIPKMMQDALGVCFDTSVGHDYLEDSDSRYEFYHKVEEKIKFDIELLNTITRGGLSKKTLNIAMAGTGVGKSLFMCHHAASVLGAGMNVLYITMEMAEEKISERIDANLLNLGMNEIKVVDHDIFSKRINKIKDSSKGKLIVKEYPTGSAHSGHFRALLEELKMKKGFKPDIIFIDYLNICASQRLKMGSNVNTYSYIKSIAEELRGLAVEYNCPLVSATQTTRGGFNNTDVGLEDTSESFGLPATADLMFAIIASEELDNMGQWMIKQLKNRYSDPNYYKRFVVGVDKNKMRLYDVEASAQSNIMGSGQEKKEDDIAVFDKSDAGQRLNMEGFKL
jgi:replicative DNA helicase